MMAALFLIFVVAMAFIWKGQRKAGLLIALLNLVLCLIMLWHHATTVLMIRL